MYLFDSYNSFLCVLVCGNSKHVISIPLSDAVFNLCIFIHVSIISFYPANWWVRWCRLRSSELVRAYSRQRRKFCQSVSRQFGHHLSAHCPRWACTDELVTCRVFRPSWGNSLHLLPYFHVDKSNLFFYLFSSTRDGHFVFLHTCIFSNTCPFLDIRRISVGHIKIVFEKCQGQKTNTENCQRAMQLSNTKTKSSPNAC